MDKNSNLFMKIEQCRNSAKRWRSFSVCLLIVLVVLLSSMVTIVLYYEFVRTSFTLKDVISKPWHQPPLSEPKNPSIFRDLTVHEMKNVMNYLKRQTSFNLQVSDHNISQSFVFCAELHQPNKSQTLKYLDSDGPRPAREATVIVFRGDKSVPVVEEYVLGPLPNIQYHRLSTSKYHQRPAPFLFRPMSKIERKEVTRLLHQLDHDLHSLLYESFEATFFNCEYCLILEEWTPMSPSVSGEDKRKMWFWTHYETSNHMLHPVDFFLLFSMPGGTIEKYSIEKIVYGGQTFTSPQQLLDAYSSKTIKRLHNFFPNEEDDATSRAYLTDHDILQKRSPPILIEPEGKRYNVNDRTVTYMNWKFTFGLSVIRGPFLFDVKYQNRRVLYELSLQEIATYQSGYQPWNRFSDILHSGGLLGNQASSLAPGVDCPVTATFINANHLVENQILTINRAICVFERSGDVPFRRHSINNHFEGINDNALIVRSVISAGSYDFILSFIFHYDILEVHISNSGHIKSTFFTIQETRYGLQLGESIAGTISQNCVHFKVDIDINGETNRYETLNIEPHTINNNDWSKEPSSRYEQLKFTKDLKMSEAQTPYRHNTTGTVFHTFYNNLYKTTYNDPRAYRIQIEDNLSEVLPDNAGNERSMSWARYKIAVTKRKDDEPYSSSIYSMWDEKEPLVQFQDLIDDNENIIDMDLVAWVTLGSHYLPQMEDIPAISTTGKQQRFLIIPFNYFDESQSVTSRDIVTLTEDEANGILMNKNSFPNSCTKQV